MKVAVFSSKPYDRHYFEAANLEFNHELVFFEPHLNEETIVLARDCPAVCAFVNDQLDQEVLQGLAAGGTRLIALRCSGFNNVDIPAANALGLTVVRVPAYSPHAVAEHTVGLILALNRKIHRAYARVREGNFALEGLIGFDLNGRTVGIIGTGKIGTAVARIMTGFGCQVLVYDVQPNPDCVELGVCYASLAEIFGTADIITLHCPLLPETYHVIDAAAMDHMRPGVMIINTSRGGLINTRDAIKGLKSGKIGYLGLDVYEEETDLFYEDLSGQVIMDDICRLTPIHCLPPVPPR